MNEREIDIEALRFDIGPVVQRLALTLLRQLEIEPGLGRATMLRRALDALPDDKRGVAGQIIIEGLAKVAYSLLGPKVLLSVAGMNQSEPSLKVADIEETVSAEATELTNRHSLLKNFDDLHVLLRLAEPMLRTFDESLSDDEGSMLPISVSEVIMKIGMAEVGIDTNLFQTYHAEADDRVIATLKQLGGKPPTGRGIRNKWYRKYEALAQALALREAYIKKEYKPADLNPPFWEFFQFDENETKFSRKRAEAIRVMGKTYYNIFYKAALRGDFRDKSLARSFYIIRVTALAEMYQMARRSAFVQGIFLERLLSRAVDTKCRP